MILPYFAITFVIGWFIALVYIEMHKKEWFLLEDPEFEDLMYVNLFGLIFAAVFTIAWPLIITYVVLQRLVKSFIKKFAVRD